MKERVLFLGQEVCQENASELIEEVMGGISEPTIHRVVELYGMQAEQIIRSSPSVQAKDTVTLAAEEVVCCEADGIMILTREENWK